VNRASAVTGGGRASSTAALLLVGGDGEPADVAGGLLHPHPHRAHDPGPADRDQHDLVRDRRPHRVEVLAQRGQEGVPVALGLGDEGRALDGEQLARVPLPRAADHDLRNHCPGSASASTASGPQVPGA
jgi:hypothetical protein